MGNQSEAGRIALVNVKQWYQILGLEVMLVVSIVFGVSRMVKECIDRTAPYPGSLHNFCFVEFLCDLKVKITCEFE